MKTSPIPFSTLLANLADPDPQVRRQSIADLMRRRKERAQAFAPLQTLLKDPDYQVCTAAVKALGQLGDPRALPTLLPLLTDQKQRARLRVAVLQALLRLDQQHSLPHLLTAVQDPSALVCQVALRALVRLDQQQAFSHLLTAVQDPSAQLRQAAVRELSNLDDARVVGLLSAALSDPAWQVRREAASALEWRKDPRVVEPLIAALSDPES